MDPLEPRSVEGKSLGEFWLSLYRRKWIFLITVATALVVAYLINERLPRVYEARAVFFVPAKPPSVSFYNQTAVNSVVAEYKEPTPKDDAQAINLAFLKSDALRNRVYSVIPSKPLDALRRDVDFKVSKEFTLQVYARDKNPMQAANIANAYVDAFEAQVQGASQGAPSPDVMAAVAAQLSHTSAQLASAREALQQFQEQNQAAMIPDFVSRVAKDRADTQQLINTTRIAWAEQNQRMTDLKAQLASENSLYSAQELATTSPLADALRKDLADLETNLAGTRTRLQEKHPDVKQLDSQLEDKRVQLNQEIDRIMRSQIKPTTSFYENLRQALVNTAVDKGVLEARIEGNERLLRQLNQQIQRHPEVMRKFDVLGSEVTRLQKSLDGLQSEYSEAKAQQAGSRPRISVVVDRALPPKDPSFPIAWLNLLAAGVLGLIGGLYYCILLDYAQRVRERRRLDPYRIAGRLLQTRREGRA